VLKKQAIDWIDAIQDRFLWRALCEHSNESSGSIKSRKSIDRLSVSQKGLHTRGLVTDCDLTTVRFKLTFGLLRK